MIIQPRIRGFICLTAHPEGCAAHVQEQIDLVKSRGPLEGGPKSVLVVGASTGYGLASRIAAAYGSGAATLGVFFEKPPTEKKTASPGYYNSAAFEKAATADGLFARSLNGDAFSEELKQQAIQLIKEGPGQVDLVVYSLASPRRTDPTNGETYKSVLKPVGQAFSAKNLNTDKKEVEDVTLPPAEGDDVAQTVKVMGGEDWELWMDALAEAGVLAEGAKSVAYSYIGPEVTWPIYKDGTIGQAKEDVERAARAISQKHGAQALVSVNKALVTQASSAIPVVPLYISLLYKVMKAKGTHEGCIEQMDRLLRSQLYAAAGPSLDEAGRIRIDDWEMDAEVQAEVAALWPRVTTEQIDEMSDFAGYQAEFLKLFGFGLPGIDYTAETDPLVEVPSLA